MVSKAESEAHDEDFARLHHIRATATYKIKILEQDPFTETGFSFIVKLLSVSMHKYHVKLHSRSNGRQHKQTYGCLN